LKKEVTVSRWITAYKKHGVGSIFPGYYNNQNAAKLTREQKQEVKQILESNPLPNQFWTIDKLKKYLSARFDIEYQSKQSYYGLLQFCNYSYRLPSLFNIRRDEALVKRRTQEIRKQIIPLMTNENYLIFCADESRIEWTTLLKRAWLKKGKRTIIKEKRDKQYQNFIGFLNIKTGEELLFKLNWQDQENIIPVLIKLAKNYHNKSIIIIWDNAGFHRGKKIRQLLGEGKPLNNIRLINFPPYAPDKNPQELVWRYGKDSISNLVFNRFNQLVLTFKTLITGRRYSCCQI
jgi:transposase